MRFDVIDEFEQSPSCAYCNIEAGSELSESRRVQLISTIEQTAYDLAREGDKPEVVNVLFVAVAALTKMA